MDHRHTSCDTLPVQAINNHLYSVHGFRGNEQDFYNTDNSCLNKARLCCRCVNELPQHIGTWAHLWCIIRPP